MKVPLRISALLLATALAATGTLVSSCGGGKSAVMLGLEKFGVVVKSSPNKIDDLINAQNNFKKIPTSGWTTQERELQNVLRQKYNVELARLVTSKVDAEVVAARAQIVDDAAATVAASTVPGNKSQFLDELKKATQEVIEEQGCAMILDMILPAQKPTDSGKAAPKDFNMVDAVYTKLIKNWRQSDLDRVVAWVDYGVRIEKDAQRFADALSADPTQYVFYVRPPMSQITAAYFRVCYATPKPILS